MLAAQLQGASPSLPLPFIFFPSAPLPLDRGRGVGGMGLKKKSVIFTQVFHYTLNKSPPGITLFHKNNRRCEMPFFIIKILFIASVGGLGGFYAGHITGDIHGEHLLEKLKTSSADTTCIDYLQETISYCENGNREGLYYTLGQFYEKCMTDTEYNFDNIEQQIQEDCKLQ